MYPLCSLDAVLAPPFFISYGKDGKAGPDGSDKYVYAVSNNGFWNNGDELYLGRVCRDLLPRLRGADWQFYDGGNGMKSSAWTSDLSQAKPILSDPGQVSMSAVQYLPQLGFICCASGIIRQTPLEGPRFGISGSPKLRGTLDAA